jgi:hypothetical protein
MHDEVSPLVPIPCTPLTHTQPFNHSNLVSHLQRTCTLKTPQIGVEAGSLLLAVRNMAAGSSRLPSTSLIFGDDCASLSAEADCALRVTARIVKGALRLIRLRITLPPCLPVAPVMRTAAIVVLCGGADGIEVIWCGDDDVLLSSHRSILSVLYQSITLCHPIHHKSIHSITDISNPTPHPTSLSRSQSHYPISNTAEFTPPILIFPLHLTNSKKHICHTTTALSAEQRTQFCIPDIRLLNKYLQLTYLPSAPVTISTPQSIHCKIHQ